MDYRQRKQTIIVSIISVFLITVFVSAYFNWFYEGATCSDGKQNQKEDGIDCDGPCSFSCERLTIKNPQVEWTKFVELKDSRYDLAAKIINSNPNFGLAQMDYIFSVFDEADKLIIEQKGKSFLLPSQTKYLVETNVFLAESPAKVELKIESVDKSEWRKISQDYKEPEIYIHDKQIKLAESESEQTQASGIIKNNSDFDFDKILVAVILYDEDKKIIGVNKTEARTVLAGEDRYFSVLWFSPILGEVRSADMRVETNLFYNDNFIRRFGSADATQNIGPSDGK